jgi:hypothetical protein
MPEMPHAGKYHGQITGVSGGNDRIVTDRPARLDNCRNAGISGGNQPISKWEKRI